MEMRRLGRTGYVVAPLAFGGNVFGWTADEPTSFALLDAFVAGGGNLIDTADSYSRWAPGHAGGESETVIGRWIARRGRHDDVVIATKVGSDMGLGYKCLRRDYVLKAAEDSLRRLGVEAIDLYQSHWDDENTAFDETLEAYALLMKQGKVRAIGASNMSAERLASALAASDRTGLPRYATLQPHYNLYERQSFEGPLSDLCIREGLGVIPYSRSRPGSSPASTARRRTSGKASAAAACTSSSIRGACASSRRSTPWPGGTARHRRRSRSRGSWRAPASRRRSRARRRSRSSTRCSRRCASSSTRTRNARSTRRARRPKPPDAPARYPPSGPLRV